MKPKIRDEEILKWLKPYSVLVASNDRVVENMYVSFFGSLMNDGGARIADPYLTLHSRLLSAMIHAVDDPCF